MCRREKRQFEATLNDSQRVHTKMSSHPPGTDFPSLTYHNLRKGYLAMGVIIDPIQAE